MKTRIGYVRVFGWVACFVAGSACTGEEAPDAARAVNAAGTSSGRVTMEAQESVREMLIEDANKSLAAAVREVDERAAATTARGTNDVRARLKAEHQAAQRERTTALHAAYVKAVRAHPVATDDAIESGAFYVGVKWAREAFEREVAAAHRVAIEKMRAGISREAATTKPSDDAAVRAIERARERVLRLEKLVRVLEAPVLDTDGAAVGLRRRALGQLSGIRTAGVRAGRP